VLYLYIYKKKLNPRIWLNRCEKEKAFPTTLAKNSSGFEQACCDQELCFSCTSKAMMNPPGKRLKLLLGGLWTPCCSWCGVMLISAHLLLVVRRSGGSHTLLG